MGFTEILHSRKMAWWHRATDTQPDRLFLSPSFCLFPILLLPFLSFTLQQKTAPTSNTSHRERKLKFLKSRPRKVGVSSQSLRHELPQHTTVPEIQKWTHYHETALLFLWRPVDAFSFETPNHWRTLPDTHESRQLQIIALDKSTMTYIDVPFCTCSSHLWYCRYIVRTERCADRISKVNFFLWIHSQQFLNLAFYTD